MTKTRIATSQELELDVEDFKNLLLAVLRQAVDDYIRLQHPRYRQKTYLQEAFEAAVDMLFDPEYRMLYIKNDFGEDMSLKDLLRIVSGLERPRIEDLQNYVIEEALAFWREKYLRTISIPKTVFVNGHTYSIQHRESPGYEVDYANKVIYLNKKPDDSESEENLMLALCNIISYHEEISLSKRDCRKLGKSLFLLLKVNSCFVGAS